MKKKGFTLIELLIVIAIIGVLIAIAVMRFTSVGADRDQRVCQANLRTMDSCLQIYAAENDGTVAGDLTYLVTAGYLFDTPACPADGTYSVSGSPAGEYATCTKAGHSVQG